MLNMKNKTSNDDELQIPMLKQPFMSMIENDRHGRIELHLRGGFDSPQENNQQLTELAQLAEEYPVALVYINSGGGRVDLLMELIHILKKFETVITVCLSDAASAGFMLWCTGDVRVVAHSAEMMAHRESSGWQGKTDHVIERYDFIKRRFEFVFKDLCGEVLTDDEMEKARRSELWFLGQDMIDRGVAISWEQFHKNDTDPYSSFEIVERGEGQYMRVGNYMVPVNIEVVEGELYSIFEILYGMQNPKNLVESVEEEMGEDSSPASPTPEPTLSEEEIRDTLRGVFGKGNYRIYLFSGIVADMVAIVNGEEKTIGRIPEEGLTADELIGMIQDAGFSDLIRDWVDKTLMQ